MRRCISLLCLVLILATTPAFGLSSESELPFQTAFAVRTANRLLSENKFDEAVLSLTTFRDKQKNMTPEKAAKKGYTHYMIDFTLGNAWLMQQQIEKALPHYLSTTQKAPDFSPGFLNLAKCYYDLNQPEKAASAFLKAYDTPDGKSGKTLYYSIVCFMLADKYPRALELSLKLFDIHKDEIVPEWKESFARIYISLNMLKEALPHVKALIETLGGDRLDMWREVLIYLYVQLHMDEKALSFSARLTQVDPTTPKWRKTYAYLLLKGSRYKDALLQFTTYSYLNPLSEEETILLGDINFTVNIPVQAVRFYEKGLKENADPDFFKKIAQGYMHLYEPFKALEWIEKGLEKETDIDLLKLKSYLLYETEQYEAAYQAYKTLTESNTESGHPWMMMGYSAWQLDRIETARQAFKKALVFDASRSQAEMALKQLNANIAR